MSSCDIDNTQALLRPVGMTDLPDIPAPFNLFHLDVGDGHRVYVEEVGNPAGVPLVMCHGGPGGRCKPHHALRVDLATTRLILFDQRNCGKSLPLAIDDPASLATNAPHILATDMEKIRRHLGIDHWHVTGASWGATLALVYAAMYPAATLSLALGKVFTGQEQEWLWVAKGARLHRPAQYRQYAASFPDLEGAALLDAYTDKVLNGTPVERQHYGDILLATESCLELLSEPATDAEKLSDTERHAATSSNMVYAHYQKNHRLPNGWYNAPEVRATLQDKPITIVHGGVDLLCPQMFLQELIDTYPHAELHIAENAGHAVDLDGNYSRLYRAALDRLAVQ